MPLLYVCEAAITVAELQDAGCPCSLDGLTGTELTGIVESASDALGLLSFGSVTGRCTYTVRPCSAGTCGCGGACACCEIDGIPLEGYDPQVTAVKIDGAVVPPAEYALVDGYILARVDGSRWPGSKNPLKADTEDDTFSITYEAEIPWDFVSKMAAIEVACEMAATLTGAETRLPPGTVSATADGVQIVIGRFPGQEQIQAVGLTWLGRFMAAHGAEASFSIVSPELRSGWTLHTVALNA